MVGEVITFDAYVFLTKKSSIITNFAVLLQIHGVSNEFQPLSELYALRAAQTVKVSEASGGGCQQWPSPAAQASR